MNLFVRSALVVAVAATGPAPAATAGRALPEDGQAPPFEHDASLFAVNAVMNSGFELVADSTTTPAKYGAFWRDAFVPEPGTPDDRIEEYADDRRALFLQPGASEVSQIVTLYGPESVRFTLTLRVRPTQNAGLRVRFQTQNERQIVYALRSAALASDSETDGTALHIVASDPPDGEGFHHYRLALGADMMTETGAPPDPWCRLSFSAEGGPVLVDDVVGAHFLPRVKPTELRELLLDEVRDLLKIQLGSRDAKNPKLRGLGLVDAETGYQTGTLHNVETGEVKSWNTTHLGIGGAQILMLRYLRIEDEDPDSAALQDLVRKRLRTFLFSLFKQNIYGPTGLYCLWNQRDQQQQLEAALVGSAFIEYVMDAAAQFPNDRRIPQHALEVCDKMAMAMVNSRDQHDLPRDVPFGRGPGGNWFGRMPEKLFPSGLLAKPMSGSYDQAWAIQSDRSWYKDFDPTVGLALMWRHTARPRYLEAIHQVIAKFDRQFDASRYDLENDTDDHYGHNARMSLEAYARSGHQIPELLQFAQEITDYRLPRDLPWDKGLWIEGLRLGSFTTADQPRAFLGPSRLHNMTAEENPESHDLEAYRHQVRELAKADQKRRILDDGHTNDASSYLWEMISACFIGDDIQPCNKGLKWEGDMGDQFFGPNVNGFKALSRSIEISDPGGDREFVAWYAAMHAHTLKVYRRAYGYRVGLPVETGRRYDIPEKYLEGWSDEHYHQVTPQFVHAETLEDCKLTVDPDSVQIASVRRLDAQTAEVVLSGPPERNATLYAAAGTRFSNLGVTDWRLRFTDPAAVDTLSRPCRLDADGRATVSFPFTGARMSIDVTLECDDGRGTEDLASGEFRLE